MQQPEEVPFLLVAPGAVVAQVGVEALARSQVLSSRRSTTTEALRRVRESPTVSPHTRTPCVLLSLAHQQSQRSRRSSDTTTITPFRHQRH